MSPLDFTTRRKSRHVDSIDSENRHRQSRSSGMDINRNFVRLQLREIETDVLAITILVTRV